MNKSNIPFVRKFKQARKNAQREIDVQNNLIKNGCISKIKLDSYICIKHSYPLGIMCFSLSCFDRMLRKKPKDLKWRTVARLAKAARKKGRIIYPPWSCEWYNCDGDYRKIPFRNYNLTRLIGRN